jgi:nucleotidyltransferase substrate binding protein (TIGR01987 family)
LERIKQRLDVARQALTTLKDALSRPKNPIVHDAAIQRFEYTFELVWKTAQSYLKFHESVEAGSPKAAIRSCFQVGLLNEEQARTALLWPMIAI